MNADILYVLRSPKLQQCMVGADGRRRTASEVRAECVMLIERGFSDVMGQTPLSDADRLALRRWALSDASPTSRKVLAALRVDAGTVDVVPS